MHGRHGDGIQLGCEGGHALDAPREVLGHAVLQDPRGGLAVEHDLAGVRGLSQEGVEDAEGGLGPWHLHREGGALHDCGRRLLNLRGDGGYEGRLQRTTKGGE